MRPARVLPPLLAAFALAALTVAVLWSPALAAGPYQATPRCDVNLRTGASTAYPTKDTIGHRTTVTVAAEIKGSYWSTRCGNTTVSGSRWARIVAVDGVSVMDAYGVKSVYAALGLLAASAPTPTPPTASPTVGPSATPEPTSSAEPSGSGAVGPSASPSASPGTAPTGAVGSPLVSVPAASGGSAAAAGSSSLGAVGEFIVLGLALASVFLAGVAFGERRRAHALNKVPSTRLNDVLE